MADEGAGTAPNEAQEIEQGTAAAAAGDAPARPAGEGSGGKQDGTGLVSISCSQPLALRGSQRAPDVQSHAVHGIMSESHSLVANRCRIALATRPSVLPLGCVMCLHSCCRWPA